MERGSLMRATPRGNRSIGLLCIGLTFLCTGVILYLTTGSTALICTAAGMSLGSILALATAKLTAHRRSRH